MTLVTNIMLKKIVYICILCMKCVILQEEKCTERDLFIYLVPNWDYFDFAPQVPIVSCH